MIETKRVAVLLDGRRVELKKDGPQIWGVKLQIGSVDPQSGTVGTWCTPNYAYLLREQLERCGLLPSEKPIDQSGREPETVETLIRALLERLGVVFE